MYIKNIYIYNINKIIYNNEIITRPTCVPSFHMIMIDINKLNTITNTNLLIIANSYY